MPLRLVPVLSSVLGSLLLLTSLAPLRADDGLVELLSVDHLPSAAPLRELARGLEVAPHRRPALAMAYYLPAPPASAAGSGGTARLLLRQDVYFRSLEPEVVLKSSTELPLDAFEYLAHALVLALFDQQLAGTPAAGSGGGPESKPGGETGYGGWVVERATLLQPDATLDDAVSWYVSVLASMGSHVLSLANEVARSFDRRGDDRQRLCAALEQGVGLFSSWRRAFDPLGFQGYAGEATADRGRTVEVADRDRFLEQVLETQWRGDPVADLAPLHCSTRRGSRPRSTDTLGGVAAR